MNLTDINLDSLSPEEQRALLAQLLADEAPMETSFPLSLNQQRLWFLDKLDGGAIYNLPIVLQIEGPLNVAYLTQALNEIMRRHAVLRTVYQEVDGQPQQVISAAATISLPVVNLQHLPLAEQEAAIRRLSEEEAQRPFNLTQDLMLRGKLLQQTAVKHILLLTMHHIASDGWSVRILTRELRTLYAAFVDQQPSPLPELPIQYVDFAHWQREWLQGEALENLLNYWKTQLADAPKVLELPHDRPRPAVQSYDGARYRLELDNELTAKLNKLAQKQGASLFMVLLSGFNVLLSRYSRQTDIVVGTAVANRNRAEIESLIGFFVNTLPLRTRLDDNPTFVELLDRVRENTLAAYQHQELPFEQLVDALQLERTLSYSPLFQVMLALQTTKTRDEAATPLSSGASLTTVPRPFDVTFAKYDLTLLMTESNEGLSGAFKYNTDLFDQATISRLANHFVNLLRHIVEQPLTPVLQLPLATNAEYRQVVHQWNDTAVDFGEPQTIQALFEAQVARTPDALALVFAPTENTAVQQLTYAQLNGRANQLAHHLISLGVQAETVVAIAVERSPEMLIGLLAILKAGGAYLPIDPTYPAERIRYMLADSAAPILLTQSHLEFSHAAAHVITIDQSEAIDAQPTHNPCTETLPEHLAYVIYTSGSTGQPKGVMVSHSNVFNVLQWTQDVFELTPADRMLARTSLSFDVAARELLSPLTCGASIVLVTTEQQRDLRQLLTVIDAHDVSIAHFTPTLLTALLNIIEERTPTDGQAKPLNLRILMSGGEPLTPLLTSRIRKNLAGTLLNSYGPSETTISVGLQVVSADTAPIAPPAPNNRFYILDERGQLAPLGVAGELHIGGTQVARGYLNRPELTAVRFIDHPEFGRLYKSGDLCRWLPNGTLEFIGRTDFQVKVRGFRIELGEIENALLAQEGVREAVVVAREDVPGDKRLVAYYVPSDSAFILQPSSLKTLPEYMIPSAFVTLDEMPLTPNGKLDRHALPAPDYVDVQVTYVPPRNAIEVTLAQTFADLLRLPHVGVHDNFFRMGGDSILTIQLVSRMAQQGYTVSVKDVFLHPSVAELAAVVHTAKPPVYASQTVQTGDAPLLPIQRAFLASNQAQMHHYNQSFLLRVKRPFAPAQLETAIRALLSHHDALRFQYTQNEAGWQQQYLAPSERVPLAFVDLEAANHAAQIEAIGAQTQASLDPLSGDLVRFVYFQSDDSNDRLLIVIHHLAVDGVSWRILLEDLATLLDGGQLPPKTSSTRDWGEALREATENGRFDAEIGRWLSAPRDTPLPLDTPDARNSMGNRHQLRLTLSERETEHLLRTLPDLHDVTLDAVLLTALTETLTDYSGHDALRVKFESHGRPELFETVNLNRTVGWFTATYPLTIPRFAGSALKRIRYTLEQVRSVPDSGISFGALHDFHPDETIRQQFAALPTAQVVYNYLGQLDNLNNERFSRSQESAGAAVSPHFQRNSLLDSNARIVNKQLHINWHVTPQISRENAESLLAAFERRVETLILEALNSRETAVIPTDFPAVSLSLPELETLQRTVDFANVETVLALAPMQVGMLFHSQFAPNSGTYIEHKLFHVRDTTFEPRRLVAALQRVIDRHDALRATFQTEGRAVQIIHRQTTLPVTFLDWRGLSAVEQQARLAQYIEQDRLTDFNLSQPPLLRFAVIQQAENEYDLLLTLHHLLMDRWSVDLVWSEVLASYAERPLPKPIPYQSYIHNLRQRADSDEFWQTYLHGFSTPTPLPAATHSAQSHGKSITLSHEISAEAMQQLTAFAREQGLTISTLFQAAWGLLLARYSRESDVVFGMVTSGRTAPLHGIESIVGLFINTLPFRVQLDAELTGLDLLAKVAQTQIELQQHEHTPLLEVQRLSELSAGSRLFDSFLLFQNTPKTANGQANELNVDRGRAQLRPGETGYPLMALVAPGNAKKASKLMLMFDTARYDAQTVKRLLSHWEQLVLGMVNQPNQPVLQLPILTPAEYHQLVHEWNNTQSDYPSTQCLHQLIEAQVERTPDAIALVANTKTLTYRELNGRANQLAHHLRNAGIGPDTLVGVCLDRSIEMLVAILGILKAGGAYLPIEPTYPQERVTFMLEDANVPLVLTTTQIANRLSIAMRTLCLDSEQQLANESWENPPLLATAENLAYCIYTSGSTGKPKGTLIEHRHVVNYLTWAVEAYRVAEGSGAPVNTSISFDATITSLFTPLLVGKKVILLPQENELEALSDLLQSGEPLSFVKLTPAHLSVLSQMVTQPVNARHFVIGGEALLDSHLTHWRTVAPHTELINEYGPTETVVGCSVYNAKGQTFPAAVPIGGQPGGPIANTQLYILDDYQEPVPIGGIGELYIGGAGVGRGYLNRPELTAERFVANPFGEGKLYKTGDLVRWITTPDGHLGIEYLGRMDTQVKVRGFRIELGEIESALLNHEQIHEAVVVLREVATAETAQPEVVHCVRCGLPSNHPEANLNEDNLCAVCLTYETYKGKAWEYFKTMADFHQLVAEMKRKRTGDYDCMMLLSGGKDSTYVLAQLVEMGLNVLSFTLDNGFISEEAKANIRRITDALGVDHIFGTTPAMNAVFVESLQQFSNVCQGCFKVIYTLSTNIARKHGISYIVTGLSRGQIFETRLQPMFKEQLFDVAQIDRRIIDARKVYHRLNDVVSRQMDVAVFQRDEIFDEVQYVDFYRYSDATLAEMYDFLDRRLSWVRPSDTGRSTNCLINDVGIYMHKKQKGYHNYALPYSWDVILGHKERDAALEELDDEIDERHVQTVLEEIGYSEQSETSPLDQQHLVAYYVGDHAFTTGELRDFLLEQLPDYMIPSIFVSLETMPLTPNGKLDRHALPAPDYASAQTTFVAPRNEVETSLVAAFTAVLRAPQVGIHDNFFWLGGDSILSIQLVSRIAQQGYTVSVKDVFLYPTVAELATAVRTANEVRADQSVQLGNAPLLPIQHRFFAGNQPQLHHFNQSYLLTVKRPIEPTQLEEAIRALLRHHDALRFQYSQDGAAWQQQYLPPEGRVPLEIVDLRSVFPEQRRAEIEALCAARQTSLDPLAGDLTRWVYFDGGGAAADRLLIVIHHLAVDGVSWRILLEDLVTLLDGGQLPPKTSSYRDWGERLQSATEQGYFDTQIDDWLDEAVERPFPLDRPTALNTIGNSHRLKLTLSREQTAPLLRTLPDLHEVTLDAALLTALTETLADWSGHTGLRVNFESHGRQELFETINLTRTAGWFTSVYPLTIPRFEGSALKRIRYTLDTLRQVKDGGISFGALHTFHPDEAIRERFDTLPTAAVVYNYLGQLNSLDNGRFSIAPESSGANVSADFRRTNLLTSNAVIIDEQLHINWSVSPQLHRESAEWLLNNFKQKLDWLVSEALTSEEWIPIRSDFPEVDLSLEKFELLMKTSNGKQTSESVEPVEREVGTL